MQQVGGAGWKAGRWAAQMGTLGLATSLFGCLAAALWWGPGNLLGSEVFGGSSQHLIPTNRLGYPSCLLAGGSGPGSQQGPFAGSTAAPGSQASLPPPAASSSSLSSLPGGLPLQRHRLQGLGGCSDCDTVTSH